MLPLLLTLVLAVDTPKDLTLDLAPINGKLFVPPNVPRSTDQLDLLIHFHGDFALMQKQFAESKLPGVLLVINHNGLSAAYSKPFSDPKLLSATLDAAIAALKKNGIASDKCTWSKLRVSFFSAGYGAVREILKDEKHFARIDALLSADSIYAGFSDTAKRTVDPANMKDFRRFAEAAADPKGTKTFILTHSALHTPAYASTVETAADLLAHLKLERKPVAEKDAKGPAKMTITSRAAKERFHVIAFSGDDGQAHMDHLRQISWSLQLLTPKNPQE